MPLSLSQGDLVTVQSFVQVNVQTAVTSFDFRLATLAGGLTDADILGAFSTSIPLFLKPLISAAVSYQGIGVQVSRGQTLYQAIYSGANAGVGTGPADLMPQQVSGLISKTTGLGGRQGRGRCYVPFPGRLDTFPANAVPPAYVVSLDALANLVFTPETIVAGAASGTLIPILVHQMNKAGTILPPTDVIGFKSSDRWATQRRRGQYGRPNFPPVIPAP